jgi:hypothetical protein
MKERIIELLRALGIYAPLAATIEELSAAAEKLKAGISANEVGRWLNQTVGKRLIQKGGVCFAGIPHDTQDKLRQAMEMIRKARALCEQMEREREHAGAPND